MSGAGAHPLLGLLALAVFFRDGSYMHRFQWRITIPFDTDQPVPPVHTDAHGYFASTTIRDPDVHSYYARLVLNDDRGPGGSVHLHDWWTQNSRSYDTPYVEVTAGSVNFQAEISSDETPLCAVWQGAHNAYQQYFDIEGRQPPFGDYDITVEDAPGFTPWTNLDTTHWPRGYVTGCSAIACDDLAHYRVTLHEFGHALRHTFDGDDVHFAGDVFRFAYARFHKHCDDTNLGFAFNEGWAEYWGQHWDPAPCQRSGTYADTFPEQVEGNVAYWLNVLASCPGVGPERDVGNPASTSRIYS